MKEYPKSLTELTLGDLERSWQPQPEVVEGEEPQPRTVRQQLTQLCDLLGIDADEVWSKWNRTQIVGLMESMHWFTDLEPSAVAAQHSFTFLGQEYGFKDKFLHISFGQWCDVEGLTANVKNPYTTMRLAAAVHIMPTAQTTYDPDLVHERADLFRKLPADVALGFGGFFLARGQQLQHLTAQHSILRQAIAAEQKVLADLQASTAGLTWYNRWLVGTYLRLKQSLLHGSTQP